MEQTVIKRLFADRLILQLLKLPHKLIERNLIYTGITRAKKALVIIGTKKALSYFQQDMRDGGLRGTGLRRMVEYT